MKKAGLFLMIVILGLKVSAQAAVIDTVKFSRDKNEISTFLNLMHIAALDSVYTGKPVTIFAPDNNAFEKLPAGVLDSLSEPANRSQLISLLNTHIVSGKLTAKETGQLIRNNNGQIMLSTIAGSKLIAKINANRNIVLIDANSDESIISQFDIQHLNAEFFIIKSVLLPEKINR